MPIDRSRLMEASDRGTIGVGSVIGTTFGTWIRNLLPFSLVAAVVLSPILLIPLFSPDFLVLAGERGLGFYAYLMLGTVLPLILTGALTYGVVQQLKGTPAGIGACVSTGFARLIPVLGVGLLTGIIVGVGLMLLAIPGLIAMCVLAVAIPAAVIERPGVTGALGRSARLTTGNRWRVFAIFLVFGVLAIVASILIRTLLLPTGVTWEPEEALGKFRTYLIVNFVVTSVLFGTLQSVASAVIYHDLRKAKEGATAADLAKVFE